MEIIRNKAGQVNITGTVRANGLNKASVFSRIRLGWTIEDALTKPFNSPDGKNGHPLYQTYWGMKNRCYCKTSPNYPYWGGRGIKVCSRWLNDFWAFVKDMGERPEGYTLERKDNDGDYCKENCIWATRRTQSRNSRHNTLIDTPEGKMLLVDACRKWNINPTTYLSRVERGGWDPIKAIATPIDTSKRNKRYKGLRVD